jgi:hypothetical protein
MDTRTGQIYPSRDEALQDLLSKGVSKPKADARLVTGTYVTLRKLRKAIHKQLRREAEGKR